MKHIAYFKLQAKNLHKDYKTRVPCLDKVGSNSSYEYVPQYFDIESILHDYECDEDNFTLMKAQHVVALMSGFDKWADMLKASELELELAKLLFDNQDKTDVENWRIHLVNAEIANNTIFSPEVRLEFFKHFFLYGNFDNSLPDYRLKKSSDRIYPGRDISTSSKPSSDVQITSLPLSEEDRAEFIEMANSVFEKVMEMMEARNSELTRKLWDVENYIDNLLKEDMLPISREYALSLIEPFMVRLVGGLAAQADKMIEHIETIR